MLSHLISVFQLNFWNYDLKLRMEKRKGRLKKNVDYLDFYSTVWFAFPTDSAFHRGHEKGIFHTSLAGRKVDLNCRNNISSPETS